MATSGVPGNMEQDKKGMEDYSTFGPPAYDVDQPDMPNPLYKEPSPARQELNHPGFMRSYPPQPEQGGYGDAPIHTTDHNPYMQSQRGNPRTQPINTNHVIVTQPYHTGAVVMSNIPDYTGLAWFACLCCCWPIGLCAIGYSCRVKEALAEGKIEEAKESSIYARTLSIVAIVFGIIMSIVTAVVVFTQARH